MHASPTRLVELFYHEVWNRADEALAREILDPGFRFRASLGPEIEGPEGFLAYARRIHAALGGYTCTIEEIIAQEERVAARLRFSGLHCGPFYGVPATGREVAWAGAAFFTMGAGRIHALWVLGDVDALRRQLGADPSAAP